MKYQITDDKAEMERIGRQIVADNPKRYPDEMFDKFSEQFCEFLPAHTIESTYYRAIYCQQMYGTSIIEYGMYGFEHRPCAEKEEYVTWFSRYIYMAFLNKERDLHLLDNKYEAYSLLKPYFKREVMLLSDENDFERFCHFVARHPSIFVKPVNLELAEGVYPLTFDSTTDLRKTFDSLLKQANELTSDDITRQIDHRLILEEEIVQSKIMAQFNPNEMSLLRVTTIFVKDKVHFFYPCLRMMCGDGKDQSGEMYSIEALIDAQTGIVSTDGIESRMTLEYHPVTGTKIKGFVIPQWNELLRMLEEASRKLPTLRYIGWDVAHTDNGWCIVEGNTNGELCMSQMCAGHGVKKELEDLIGFHVPFGFMLETVEQIIENRKQKKRSS